MEIGSRRQTCPLQSLNVGFSKITPACKYFPFGVPGTRHFQMGIREQLHIYIWGSLTWKDLRPTSSTVYSALFILALTFVGQSAGHFQSRQMPWKSIKLCYTRHHMQRAHWYIMKEERRGEENGGGEIRGFSWDVFFYLITVVLTFAQIVICCF